MSLTKDEWVEMWEYIKHIEYEAKALASTSIKYQNRNYYSRKILGNVKMIKDKIQQVIGQME
jgi:hypothetical protein